MLASVRAVCQDAPRNVAVATISELVFGDLRKAQGRNSAAEGEQERELEATFEVSPVRCGNGQCATRTVEGSGYCALSPMLGLQEDAACMPVCLPVCSANSRNTKRMLRPPSTCVEMEVNPCTSVPSFY